MYAKIFKKGIAFEIDINAKQILYTNLIKNKLNKKVEILGKAENNFLENFFCITTSSTSGLHSFQNLKEFPNK